MMHCSFLVLLILVSLFTIVKSLSNVIDEKPATKIIEGINAKELEICSEETENWESPNNLISLLSSGLITQNTNYDGQPYDPGYNYYNLPTFNNNLEAVDGSRNYERQLHSYINPKVLASYNRYPVSYLPPVYLKYYRRLPQQANGDSYVRAPRMIRPDNDFWEQLQNDSIMKNILPTMPAPFYRDANSRGYPQDDCGLPVIFRCNPKLFFGLNVLNYNRPMERIPYVQYRHLNREGYDHVLVPNEDGFSTK